MKHLKLYHFPMSRSARVKWLLHELRGDDFEVERVALHDGEQHEDTALERNPNHAVPVLEITDEEGTRVTMIESGAMLSLLADLYPDKALAPAVEGFSAERSDYLQMLHFGSSWMDMMLWQIRLHRDLLPEDERDPATIARFRHKIATEVEPQLKTRLKRGPYICGEKFTAADCVTGHNVMWAGAYGLCKGKVFGRYLERLSERPAYQAAFADAGEFVSRPGS